MILLAFLNTLIPAAALALLTFLALRFSRMNAATRYAAWWAVLAAMVFLPFAPEVKFSTPAPAAPAAEIVAAPLQLPLAYNPPPAAPVEVKSGAWMIWAASLWATFALYRALRIVRSYFHLRRVKGTAQPAPPEAMEAFDTWRGTCGVKRKARVLLSAEISSPIAIGFLHPAVILPETLLSSLTPAELDHVLLHELAHIARYDDWTNLAARLAGTILGLHPVAAFAFARLENERELACDDWVVASTGDARPYAASLARLFELARTRRQPTQALASGITGSQLGDRVERLLTHGRRFTRRASLISLGAIATALIAMVIAGAQSPAWVAFAQERALPVPPAPPAPPVKPAKTAPPVAPAPPTRSTLEHLVELGQLEQGLLAPRTLQQLEAEIAAMQVRNEMVQGETARIEELLSRENPSGKVLRDPEQALLDEQLRFLQLQAELRVKQTEMLATQNQLNGQAQRLRELQHALAETERQQPSAQQIRAQIEVLQQQLRQLEQKK
ncbi:MAG: M56 family metallopeptidase [Acidobacteriota bacterium]